MALIQPFRAIRPATDKAPFVVSRSYEEYAPDELHAILEYNPFSFLHIINPGFKFHKHITGHERFGLVHNRYLEFLEEGVFQRDSEACFYLYEISQGDFSCLGFFCACSVIDYQKDTIKKHEDTLEHRETLFADYLETVGFNAEPVLMTYQDHPGIGALLRQVQVEATEYDFTTTDKIRHRLWKMGKKEHKERLITLFDEIDALYIADGHHRSASSHLLANRMKTSNGSHNGHEAYNYFMAYLIPESQIRIFEFNRMVRDLNGHSKEEFLIKLDTYFRIEKKEEGLYKPSKKHHFSMYLDGEFYSLYLRKTQYHFTDVLSELDTQILFKTILEPILGIHDLRNDKRIAYGYGKHNSLKMKESIDAGDFAVGFGLVPLTMNEIKAIADAGLVMPPKSTYIEPKLRSGMAIYEF
ncbi:MAG: DUF1015 domain-containing protein [Bacteroidota bacterium]